jgi:hypothetical protein
MQVWVTLLVSAVARQVQALERLVVEKAEEVDRLMRSR